MNHGLPDPRTAGSTRVTDKRTRTFNKARTAQLKAGLRIRKDTYGEIVRLLKQAEAEIKATLAASSSEYEQFYLPQLQKQVKVTLSQVEAQSAQIMNEGANQSWQAGIDLVDKPLAAGGIEIAGLIPAISTDQLLAMRTFAVDRIKDVSVQLANKISNQLGLAMIGSQSVGDTVSNVQRLFKTQGRSRALTIVRTELGRAYAVATHQRMGEAQKVLPGLKKQWRRSGKVHSRTSHDAIDGQIREHDELFQLANGVEMRHPRDPAAPASETINCGCEELPFMAHWEVKSPDRKPFSDLEKQLNPRKRALSPQDTSAEQRAYKTALTGGKHAGKLRRYRDVPSAEIKRGIRSLEKQITKHQSWIQEPTKKTKLFYNLHDARQRALLEKRWPDDIQRQREELAILKAILVSRNED